MPQIMISVSDHEYVLLARQAEDEYRTSVADQAAWMVREALRKIHPPWLSTQPPGDNT